MKKHVLLISFLLFATVSFTQVKINKVEPPYWWVGMNSTDLQLLIHGDNISEYNLEIKNSQVKIKKVHQAESANYLFVDLTIPASVLAGKFQIDFKKGQRTVYTIDYVLKERRKGSADRLGATPADVIYLITPDRFVNGDPSNDEVAGMKEGLSRDEDFGRHGGDIQGIIDYLPYIKQTGFTSIWLNPVLENDMPEWSYHGYATTDYYNVDKRFGSNEEYINLGKIAYEMGVGMIMDIIVNHCGLEHYWLTDPPFSDWVNYQGQEENTFTNHRKYTVVDPYASNIDRKEMTEGWFVGAMPDLNQRNPFMSTYLIQNSIWWIEATHITGIRQDTYSYPFKEFMTDWTCAIKNEYPNFYIVGEEWVDSPALISYWQEGKNNADGNNSCLPGLMDFPLCFALHNAMQKDESWSDGLVKLYESIAQDYSYPDPSQLVIFPDNHDMSRIYTQVGDDFAKYKMAISYILTMRGIPQLYYGTEIVMSNTGDDSHGNIRSDFPGGWPNEEVNIPNKVGLSDEQTKALNFCENLLNWRKQKDVIHNGKLTHFAPYKNMYVYFRHTETESVMIILNKNKEKASLEIERYAEMLDGRSMGKDINTGKVFKLNTNLELDPMQAYIIELR